MTTAELAKTPVLCDYQGYRGLLGYDVYYGDYLFFLSNERDGMECATLLKAHPEYKYSYAINFHYDLAGNIEFEGCSITNIHYPYGTPSELIFKKQTKFSL